MQHNEEVKEIKSSLFQSMIPSTAKVMFVDSIIVSKEDFLTQIPLNKESGKFINYDVFFKEDKKNRSVAYLDEFGNSCIFTRNDSANSAIFLMDKIGGEWTTPQKISYFNIDLHSYNYPFLMSDGITLFFSAKGKNTLGGYDLFMTRVNKEKGKLYEPENLGLPYNSEANDYLIAFDEMDSLGWLVTDRNQEKDSVCIYLFVPSFPRIGFDSDAISARELESYASLSSIKETWKFGDRENAIKRLKELIKREHSKNSINEFFFVVNDDNICTNVLDFTSDVSRKLSQQFIEKKNVLQKIQKELENLRTQYHNTDRDNLTKIKNTIKIKEDEEWNLNKEIKTLSKKIRKLENNALIN